MSSGENALMSDRIERVEAPTREEFEKNYLNKNKPVVLTGVVDKWGAYSKWDPDYLKSVAGESTIKVPYREDGSFFDYYVDRPKRVELEMKFGELVDLLVEGKSAREYYLTEYDLREVSAELMRDIDFSRYFDVERQPYDAQIFLGHDTCMPLHYHGVMEAFLCQIRAEKRIVLYSPKQYAMLYPGKWYKPIPLFSRIDGRKIFSGQVDLERFPKFRNVKPIEFTLKPGEMLFIPIHWWHVTRVPGYQVSVTHFFKSKLRCWTFPTPGLQNIGREVLEVGRRAVNRARSLLRRAPQSQEA